MPAGVVAEARYTPARASVQPLVHACRARRCLPDVVRPSHIEIPENYERRVELYCRMRIEAVRHAALLHKHHVEVSQMCQRLLASSDRARAEADQLRAKIGRAHV